jgi:hypothetical protein
MTINRIDKGRSRPSRGLVAVAGVASWLVRPRGCCRSRSPAREVQCRGLEGLGILLALVVTVVLRAGALWFYSLQKQAHKILNVLELSSVAMCHSAGALISDFPRDSAFQVGSRAGDQLTDGLEGP